MLTELKFWRRKVANEEKLPPYCIFHDTTLIEISNSIPSTKENLMNIRGFGKKRIENYGDDILGIVRRYNSTGKNIISHNEIVFEKKDKTLESKPSRVWELGESNNPAVIQELINYTQSKNANERKLAASALGKLSMFKPEIREAVLSLIVLLGDEKPQVRQYALKALGEIGDPRAKSYIGESLSDEKEYNRKSAQVALQKIDQSNKKVERQINFIGNEKPDTEYQPSYEKKTEKTEYGPNSLSRSEAENKLKNIFGLEHFYDTQWETIKRVLNGERVLLIEKTGFGKSLCYQFPATQFSGTTVIFSPLIALMRDQVKKLNELGIKAKCINSEQSPEENSEIIEEAIQGRIKILYIAPERQENKEWIDATRQMNLSMVVIDEAHCVSVWGHDFRPSFRRIINLVNLLPKNFPVLATTATATKRVEKDILQQVSGGMLSLRGNLLRENFKLKVIKVKSEDEKLAWLGENINSIRGNGIIYTGTRTNTEIYSGWLQSLGISSIAYNAGLDAESRKHIEDGLMNNEWKCVVSTTALGMGIDKPDIRFIVHTQIPESPIHYYQEIGRAGRDEKPADVILFYNSKDVDLPKSFIKNSRPHPKRYQCVIDALKLEPLGEHNIMRETNLNQNQVRVIKADLIDQGIINEVYYGRSKKYELKANAPELNIHSFEELRNAKLAELDKILEYVKTDQCRMRFLCDYLGDKTPENCGKCDNDKNNHINLKLDDYWKNKIEEFHSNYFPELLVESKRTNMVNGVASSYYGFSNVGAVIHRCKYENGGDFPDFLLKLTLKAFRKRFGKENFDLIAYVPPTESGNLVKNFAEKISYVLKIPISHKLKKIKDIKPQKIFQNWVLKRDNVKDAFIFENPQEIEGKSILLIDDIFDSGHTIKEIGRYFTKLGAGKMAPLTIAKTIGGDIS